MTTDETPEAERLLTPGEVAELFRVDPKTVTRWAAAGRIRSIRTPGGHRRFRWTEVQAMLGQQTTHDTPEQAAASADVRPVQLVGGRVVRPRLGTTGY